MFELPKLIFILLVGFAVWYVYRWINGPARERDLPPRRQAALPPRGRSKPEDLTACRACGAYVAAGARSCGRTDCPYPR